MAGGMLGISQGMRRDAMAGMRFAGSLEEARENQNASIKQAEMQQQVSGVISGATTGAAIGGPWGALIGGVAGYALTNIF